MLARKVVTRSGRKVRGLFPSAKLNRMVEWESLLERDAILLFEFSPGVLSYREQPCLITYFDEETEQTRKYYPDFEITKTNEEIVHIEVKSATALLTSEVQNKLKKVSTHYQGKSISYCVLTDDRIRREPLQSNLKELIRVTHRSICIESIKTEIHEKLLTKPCSFFELASEFGKPQIMKMLAMGMIGCDWESPLLQTSIIHPREADHDQILF